MRISIIVLSFLIMSGCSHSRRNVVIPHADGINEINYSHIDKQKALYVTLKWADDYCSYKEKDFIVLNNDEAYQKGLVSEKADGNIRRGVKVASAVGHLPVFGGAVAAAVGGETNQKLLFKCVVQRE